MSETIEERLNLLAQDCAAQGVTYRNAFLEIREMESEATDRQINDALLTTFAAPTPTQLAQELLQQGDAINDVACALVQTFVNPPLPAPDAAVAIFDACQNTANCTEPTPFEMAVALLESDECAEEDPYKLSDTAMGLIAVYPTLSAIQMGTTLNSANQAANNLAPSPAELATALRGTDTYTVTDVAHAVQSQSISTPELFATIIDSKTLSDALLSAGYNMEEADLSVQAAQPNGANVFMRDNPQETGCQPSSDKLWSSPDIIPRQQLATVEELQMFLDKPDKNFGQQIEDGQDNFIYLRVENKVCSTPVPADSPIAYLFYKSSATTLNPSQWLSVGLPLALPLIQSGEQQIVGPIVWPKEDIPTVAADEKLHFCFICYLQSSHKIINIPLNFPSGEAFKSFLSSHNNLTQRNFNVVNLSAGAETGTEDMAPVMEPADGTTPPKRKRKPDYHFFLSGLTGLTARYRLTLSTDLPEGTQLTLRFRKQDRQYTLASPNGPVVLARRVRLKSDKDVRVRVFIELPTGIQPGEYNMAFSQFHKQDLVGTVNYLVVVNE